MKKQDLEKYLDKFETALNSLMKRMTGSNAHEGLDITIAQIPLVMVIYQKGSCKMSDISDMLQVTMGNVTAMIDRLVRELIVERFSDSNDRRVVMVKLTQKGIDIATRACAHRRDNIRGILEHISDKHMKVLAEIIEEINDGIKERKNK